MHIGQTIRELRKKKGMNQVELANACGIAQTSLSQIESGQTANPKSSTLKKLGLALGIPEQLIFLLSVDVSDVPEEKKAMYASMFPMIRKMMIELFYDEAVEIE